MSDLQTRLEEVRASTGCGFASLLVFGATILVCGALSFFVSDRLVALALFLLGGAAVPATFGLQKLLGFPPLAADNPINPLVALLAIGKLVHFFAVAVVFLTEPALVTVALAAIVGGYYLPFAWLYGTRIYIVLGLLVGAAPWPALVFFGAESYPYVLLFWGLADWTAAFLVHRTCSK